MSLVDDVKAAKRTEDLVESIVGKRPIGPDGQGYMALCPFHEDTHESLRIFRESGGFVCFTCGAKGGDCIDLWAKYSGVDTKAAIRQLAGDLPLEPRLPKVPEPKVEKTPAPTQSFFHDRQIPKVGEEVELNRPGASPIRVRPSLVHVYRTPHGEPFALVLRVDGGVRKSFRPARWDGSKWWAVAQDVPRSLYGLEDLRDTKRQVLVVEGEKAADAARRMAQGLVAVVTWPGGAQAIDSISWGPLAGRRVVLWPDNDAPGKKAMQGIAERLHGVADEIKMVNPVGLPEKGDAADLEEVGGIELVPWLRDRVSLWSPPAAPKVEKTPIPTFAGPEEVMAAREEIFPFHILGQHEGRAYFLKRADGRVVSHTLTSLTKPEVLGTLAAPAVWQKAFGGQTEDGHPVGWKVIGMAAQSHIVRAVEGLPEFDPNLTRGRGCWPHGSGVAWNRGDSVLIDGSTAPDNYVGGHVYERGAPLPIDLSNRLSNQDGARLVNVLAECQWAHPHAPILVAGWIALAPICGALQWRPHIWITGPHGSGKSTVLDEIILPAIGSRCVIRLAGNTSEAGLRQTIGKDSLPVLLDEAEADGRGMRSILELARSASTGDIIVRGSATNSGAHHFHIRSAFCFSAIDHSVAKAADESRITRLALKKSTDPDADRRYLNMRDNLAELMDRTFSARLGARMVRLAPVILRSVATFEHAVTRRFGSRRLAQQYGALLAGAYALTSEVEVAEEEAGLMVSEYVPDGEQREETQEDDATRMLHHFLSYQLDIQGTKVRMKVTVGELVERLTTVISPMGDEIPRAEAEDVLARWGVRVETAEVNQRHEKVLTIAKNHPQLGRHLFRDTPWSHSYSDRFRDLDGWNGGQKRFAGARYSSVIVPYLGLEGEE